MEFTTRATYIAAVANWKAEYKQLSIDIRAAKLAYKAAQRSNDIRDIWKTLSTLTNMQVVANNMIYDRHAAKVTAQEQYLAEKESTAAVA